MSSKGPDGRMLVFPAQFTPNRFHVHLDDHIIGVLRFDAAGCTIVTLKLGRDEDGNNVFKAPGATDGHLARPFPTTTAAAEACLRHWLDRTAA